MSLIRDLSSALGMPQDDIMRIISNAPRRYKLFAIPKRSGNGHRIIAQPARELKAIQRLILRENLTGLKTHAIATAYREGRNIKDNALPHVKSNAILKLDFRDFFHSIQPDDFQTVLKRSELQFPLKDRRLLNLIFFWLNPFSNKLCLSIGAPSSPLISNAVMEPLDRELARMAKEYSVACTRYADDITLSANNIENLLKVERLYRKAVEKSRHPKLQFNEDKRGIFTKASRRAITGLVITPEAKVSLGRSRKRTISAALHRIAIGRDITIQHIQETRGWLAHAKSVEPQFFKKMAAKYPNAFRATMNAPIVRIWHADQQDKS